MLKWGIPVLLILTLMLSISVNAEVTVRKGEMLHFGNSSYTFNQTMVFKNIKADNKTLWLNDTAVYAVGTGTIDIILNNFKSKDNFSFIFKSNVSNDTVLFRIGEEEFYRHYVGTSIVVSKGIETVVEDSASSIVEDTFDPYTDLFGGLFFPLFIIMTISIIIYMVFGGRHRGWD